MWTTNSWGGSTDYWGDDFSGQGYAIMTEDGSATHDQDYVPVGNWPYPSVFGEGPNGSASIDISTIADNLDEGSETVIVHVARCSFEYGCHDIPLEIPVFNALPAADVWPDVTVIAEPATEGEGSNVLL